MTRRILFVALLLSSSFTFAQTYGVVGGWPYGPVLGPIVTPPIVELPPPVEPMGAITYGPLAPVSPLVYTPVLDFGWTSTFTGASNATPGNRAGATNSTLAGILYGSSTPRSVGFGRHHRGGGFDTGAAYYTDVAYGDPRSVAEVAARLRKQPRATPRVYTNDDIARLKKTQEGSTLAPQKATPTNPPQR